MTDATERPLLVMLPGLDGTGRLLEPLARHLGDAFERRLLDYPRAAHDYETLTGYVAAALPVDRPFVLVGESFAGPIALALGARRPPGLRGIVLSASFARYPYGAVRALAPVVRALPSRAAPMALVTRFVLGPWHDRARRRFLLDAIEDVPRDILRARVVAALAVDARDALHATNAPLLYLRATRDRVIGSRPAEEIVALARDATSVDVEGPHFLLQVATPACADAILAFVERCASGPGRDR